MMPDDPDTAEQDLLRRYREASVGDRAQPRAATRAAILAEARRIAAEQSRPEAIKPFDTRTGAANQGRWRLAAGTFGVAVLAALLMVPYYHERPPSPSRADLAEVARSAGSAPLMKVGPPAGHAPVADELAPDARVSGSVENLTAPAAPPKQEQADVAASPLREQSLEQGKARDSASGTRANLALAPQAARRAAPSTRVDGAVAAPGIPAPLLDAVRLGDLDQVTALLGQGASVGAVDGAGRSALFLAVVQDRADLVQLLLAHGADPALADRTGQTPLDWARQQHAGEMVRLLSPPLATK